MSKFKKQLLSIIIMPLSLLSQPLVMKTENIEPQSLIPQTPIEAVRKYAQQYGIDANLLYSVLYCESNLNPDVKSGDSGNSHGIAQIKDKTWAYLESKLGEDLDEKSWLDAIKLTAFAFSINEGYHWTPYRAIKNGGSYTFFNRHKNQYETVYCAYKKIPI